MWAMSRERHLNPIRRSGHHAAGGEAQRTAHISRPDLAALAPVPRPRSVSAPAPFFRRADGKPTDGVQDGERAEHDKENGFVHVWINVM
jgi:hypothetical protein